MRQDAISNQWWSLKLKCGGKLRNSHFPERKEMSFDLHMDNRAGNFACANITVREAQQILYRLEEFVAFHEREKKQKAPAKTRRRASGVSE